MDAGEDFMLGCLIFLLILVVAVVGTAIYH